MLKFDRVWFCFFISKVFYSFFSHFIYIKFSSLGDTLRYFNSGFDLSFSSSTAIMDTIGSLLMMIFKLEVIGSLLISIITFYAIRYSISFIVISRRQLILLLLIMSIPSIGIWTSILSKESLCLIAFCFITPILYASYCRPIKKANLFFVLLGFLILFIFKPQYLISVFCFIVFGRFLSKTNKYLRLNLVVFSLLFIIGGIYYWSSIIIDPIMYKMKIYFITDTISSTRNDLDIFNYPYSYLYNIPYGFYLSFVGPTLTEALNNYSFLFFYFESIILISYIIYLFSGVLKKGKINVNVLFVFVICCFLIMLVHYPFGVYNPGSALRYRSSFIYYFFIMGLILKKKVTIY